MIESEYRQPVRDQERDPPGGSGQRGDGGANEPPRWSPAQPASAASVALRRPWLILIPALLLAAAGVAIGLARKPVYTATNHGALQIASSDSTALSGISEATPVEAASISRAVLSDAVLDPVAAKFGLSRRAIAADVSATPVPQSGDITFSATSSSSTQATALVNALTNQMRRYVQAELNPSADAPRVLTQYRNAVSELNALQAQPALRTSPAEQAASLRVASLRTEYQDDLTAPVTTLAGFNTATTASSDRRSKLLLYGVIGLVAGLAGGLGLCALRAQRLNRSESRL